MHQRLMISVRDLRFVEILCRHCNTRVILDLEAEFAPPRSRFPAPRECPRCQDPFDSAIPGAIEALQKVYQSLAKIGNAVAFVGGEEQRLDRLEGQ